jgi:hypothetical protein
MSENKEILEKCEFCFSLIAYLHGYCPVCNDTGFVKKQVKQPLLLNQDNDRSREELTYPRMQSGNETQDCPV